VSLTFREFTGAAVAPVLDDLAALRIAVFREWPYIYDGDPDYERRYLSIYAKKNAIVVGAFDGAEMVGAATGMPLSDHSDDIGAAFAGSGLDPAKVFYCAESVLLPGFRGHGAGHAFFDRREGFARALGFAHCAFCAVIRPEDHPQRPAGYRPLDRFWRRRGYETLPGGIARFSWRDIGDAAETEKPLQFWIRRL